MLLDGALIDLKPHGKFVDGNAVQVTLDQLLQLGWFEAPADRLWVQVLAVLGPDGTISRRFRRHSPWSEWFKQRQLLQGFELSLRARNLSGDDVGVLDCQFNP
jgi:hypothetical protein